MDRVLNDKKSTGRGIRYGPHVLDHQPIFPQVQSTPDLYFREEIRNLKLHHDENEATDMQDRDNEYLMRQGRLEKVYPLEMPDIDRW